MDSLNFDSMVAVYDKTRTIDNESFKNVLTYIADKFPAERFTSLFEPGIGTGRIAIPLSKLGYRVTGIDISSKMIEAMHQNPEYDSTKIESKVADATMVPYADNSFDLGIVNHLFYFIREWKKAIDELFRVVKGSVLFLNTGSGEEIPEFNERYKQLCGSFGNDIKNVGLKNTSEAVAYLQQKSFRITEHPSIWSWNLSTSYRKAFEHIKNKSYSFTQLVPDEMHLKVISEINRQFLQGEIKADEAVIVKNSITLLSIDKMKC